MKLEFYAGYADATLLAFYLEKVGWRVTSLRYGPEKRRYHVTLTRRGG